MAATTMSMAFTGRVQARCLRGCGLLDPARVGSCVAPTLLAAPRAQAKAVRPARRTAVVVRASAAPVESRRAVLGSLFGARATFLTRSG